MDKEMQLLIDALFLASTITEKLHDLEKKGELTSDNRLLELGRKAWSRYERRRAMVKG